MQIRSRIVIDWLYALRIAGRLHHLEKVNEKQKNMVILADVLMIERATKTKPITRRGSFWRLPHRAVIKDLAFAALNKAFCLPVKIEDWTGKGLDRAYRADPGAAEGTADALFECCASLVIEKRHYHIVILLADKIELALKCNPIMVRRKGAVHSVCHTVPDLPV